MRFELEVQTDDADATTDPTGLISWILLGVASQVATSKRDGLLVDRNGNRIGSWVLSGADHAEQD